jgi:hypothetical protein
MKKPPDTLLYPIEQKRTPNVIYAGTPVLPSGGKARGPWLPHD